MMDDCSECCFRPGFSESATVVSIVKCYKQYQWHLIPTETFGETFGSLKQRKEVDKDGHSDEFWFAVADSLKILKRDLVCTRSRLRGRQPTPGADGERR
jgi:hypothetical protein